MALSIKPAGYVIAVTAVCALSRCSALAKDSTEKVTQGSAEVFICKVRPSLSLSKDYLATNTSYFLHVPEQYAPQRPHALILAISPGPDGAALFSPFRKAAQKHGVIFACPHLAGNETPADKRGQMAVDTLADVRSKFNIDPERIYVAGFSGGGRMSTGMVAAFPGCFAGQIAMGGVYFAPDPAILSKLKTKLGHYLFAGEKCFNRPESERANADFAKAGIPHDLLIGMGQGHALPTPEQGLKMYEWFVARYEQRALEALQAKCAASRELTGAPELLAGAGTAPSRKELREKSAREALTQVLALENADCFDAVVKACALCAKEFSDTACRELFVAAAARMAAKQKAGETP